MKAVGLTRYLPVSDPQSPLGIELPKPAPRHRDLLVRIEVLIVGRVGGVAIQLAKLAGFVVITTASRAKTREWVLTLGTDEVLDHLQPLRLQLVAAGRQEVDFIANFNNTEAYWSVMADIIRSQGRIVSIVENEKPA